MGKILAACPVTIPIRLNSDDKSNLVVTEEINKAIKATARTITKTKLSDRIRSEDVLHKAGLKCLNEAVASIMAVTVVSSKKDLRTTRSVSYNKICLPVPGYPALASNLMAGIWNDIPEFQIASNLAAAKSISRKWAKNIPR